MKMSDAFFGSGAVGKASGLSFAQRIALMGAMSDKTESKDFEHALSQCPRAPLSGPPEVVVIEGREPTDEEWELCLQGKIIIEPH